MKTPLVLVHGLWDSPILFNKLLKILDYPPDFIFAPFLPHKFGRTPLMHLAHLLDELIRSNYGESRKIDLLGFSMGGVVSRIWLQELGGISRTRRFFSVGSPQKGTLLALPVPYIFFPGIADMKPNSRLLRKLNVNYQKLQLINCRSYYCKWDLMVSPGWNAVLPVGKVSKIKVSTHKQLITNIRSIKFLKKEILN